LPKRARKIRKIELPSIEPVVHVQLNPPGCLFILALRIWNTMPAKIKIQIDDIALDSELNDGECAKEIARALPLEIEMSRWGDEYYGNCGVRLKMAGPE
jgi:hypothetical protein